MTLIANATTIQYLSTSPRIGKTLWYLLFLAWISQNTLCPTQILMLSSIGTCRVRWFPIVSAIK